jgi:hypothetical protein
MNEDETIVAKLLLADVEKTTDPKGRFDAIVRYELFTRAAMQRANAEVARNNR